MNSIYRDTGETKMMEKICIIFLSSILIMGCLGIWGAIRSGTEIDRLRSRIVVLEDQQSYLYREVMVFEMKAGELDAKIKLVENEIGDVEK